uniref:C-type lectin domain-containing protein n=1 Tax=Oreochromis aureus TaxID=47969 RepID=A0AAZ1X6E5_OREAU
MSSDIYAKPDLSKKVRYSRKEQEDRAEWEQREVDIYESTDEDRDSYDHFQDLINVIQHDTKSKCPDRWTRFGSSCYFKSHERKTWSDSRRDCQDKGADLVMINSKEEQEFINELNMRGESWIGLRATYKQTSGGYKWEWVDGSALTETYERKCSQYRSSESRPSSVRNEFGAWM